MTLRYSSLSKKIINNPSLLLPFLFARFRFARSVYKYFRKSKKIGPENHQSLFKIDIDKVIYELNHYGLFVGLQLSIEVIQEINTFALQHNCFGDSNQGYPFNYSEKQLAEEKFSCIFDTGEYFLLNDSQTISQCPTLTRLSQDPALLEICRRYFKTEPTFHRSHLTWLFAHQRQTYNKYVSANFFHVDIEGMQCLKFFFFLTDVDLLSGPHVCIRGSHIHKRIRHQFSFRDRNDASIMQGYQLEQVIQVCGEKGMGFVEDPLCFHRSTRPILRDRLLLQLIYTG